MPLPVISGTEVQTPPSGTYLDVGPLRRAALAPGELAQAVGANVSKTFEGFAEGIANMRDTSALLKADVAMKTFYDNFAAQLPKKQNSYNTWLEEFRTGATQVEENFMSKAHVTGPMRQRLRANFALWNANRSSEVGYNALERERGDAVQAAVKSAHRSARDGNLDAAHAALNIPVKQGWMSQSQADQVAEDLPDIAATAQVDKITADKALAVNGPEIVEKNGWLKRPGVHPDTVKRLTDQLITEQRKYQGLNADDAITSIELGGYRSASVSPEDAKKMFESGQIGRRGYDAIRAHFDYASKDYWTGQIREGAGEPFDFSGVEKDFAEGHLTQKSMDFLKGIQRQEVARVVTMHKQFWNDQKQVGLGQVEAWHPQPDTARAEFEQFRDLYRLMPAEQRTPLYKALDAKLAAVEREEQKEENAIRKQTMDLGLLMRNNGGFRPPVPTEAPSLAKEAAALALGTFTFGLWMPYMPDWVPEHRLPDTPSWEASTPPDIKHEAQRRYGNWTVSMNAFFATHKTATLDQAREFSDRILRTHILDDAQGIMKMQASMRRNETFQNAKQGAPSEDEFKTAPQGMMWRYEGGVWKKQGDQVVRVQ
jgi:hypothetical protein